MGLLDRVIKNSVDRAVNNAVRDGVRKVVEPAVERAATGAVNSAADKINAAAAQQQPAAAATQSGGLNTAQVNQAAGTLGGIFGSYAGAMQNMANEAAKNMKVCPSCGEACRGELKFCPECGAKLPEQTLAQGAVCSSCGKQNDVGTKFCAGCGAKLPAAAAEEQAAQAADDAAMAQWDALLPQYPKWSLGGNNYNLEQSDGYIMFAVKMENDFCAQNAVNQYRELLLQNGFRKAGEYPSIGQLYKMMDGVCYHCDTEHCFEGDTDCPSIYFNVEEPSGGYDYVKPEPKKQPSLKDLFKF